MSHRSPSLRLPDPPSPACPLPRWMSLSQAARYASMCKATLKRYIAEGEIYGTLKGGKWYIDRETIDAFFLGSRVREDAIVTSILGALR